MKGSTRLQFELLRALVKAGARIFTLEQARRQAVSLGIHPARLKDILYSLKKDQWIQSLKRGLYAITVESGFEPIPHEYEIATALVHPSAISHWSALHYHHLTQQIPTKIFVLTLTGTSIPRQLPNPNIRFVRVKSAHYFGIDRVWIGENQVAMTDPERTLLDGLMRPQYCGDLQEVLYAFKAHQENLDLSKIIEYACHLDVVIAKRLGFILDTLGYPQKQLRPLLEVPIRGIRKLDANAPKSGPVSHIWKIQENIGDIHADFA